MLAIIKNKFEKNHDVEQQKISVEEENTQYYIIYIKFKNKQNNAGDKEICEKYKKKQGSN